MWKKLMIVESPSKARTIKKYIWKDFEVVACVWHVEDLPSSKIWVDIENNFEPEYEIMKWKKKIISELKKLVKSHDVVYLATDADREWEAISWHLKRLLNLPNWKFRISSHEITKSAIQDAIKNPREIDMNLVHAQQWRRILDRLVWYKVSPVLRSKIKMWLSAWRVQSVAVKLIVEKETEIRNFKPNEFWSLNAFLQKENLSVDLSKIDGKIVKFKNKKELQTFLEKLNLSKAITEKSNFKVSDLMEKQVEKLTFKDSIDFELINTKKTKSSKKPPIPFITSTLQQDASNKLGRWVKQVMQVAQKLYEQWFITYMRTDDPSLSAQAIKQAQKFIETSFWKEFSNPIQYKSKSKNSQEAHEAIRPTDLSKDSDMLKLSWMEAKLYDLIQRRTLASQMKSAQTEITTYEFSTWNTDIWISKWEIIKFEWFLKVYGWWKETFLPKIKLRERIKSKEIIANQKFTKATARYTESTLVKQMESLWIWRPSTYANIISTIILRWYVEKIEKKLVPTEIAFVVTKYLNKNFEDMMDYDFTAKMEENLDKISLWKLDEKKMLSKFWSDFERKLTKAEKKEKQLEKVWETCPECSADLVFKFWRFWKFIACSNYPECKYKAQTEQEQNMQEELEKKYKWETCPAWWTIVVKKSRNGYFLASSEYPDVKRAMAPKAYDLNKKYWWENCDKCKDWTMIVKNSRRWYFLACDKYPECKNAKKLNFNKEE